MVQPNYGGNRSANSDGHRVPGPDGRPGAPDAPQEPSAFRLDARELEPGTTEVLITGEVDLSVVETLQAALAQASDGGGNILVDLSDCTFMDSSGLALFVRTSQELADGGRRLLLHGCTGQVRHVLDITGLSDGGLVEHDRDAALRALQADAPA
jgi:anti-anti-sigma factor